MPDNTDINKLGSLPTYKMNSLVKPVTSCRFCRYYDYEGRRGGNCNKLQVHVSAGWSACSYAVAPFAPSWEYIGDLSTLFHDRVAVSERQSEKFLEPIIQRRKSFSLSSFHEA
ncbi:hypothetical protein TUMEXPCC7403_12025 [Tumidithrix helvetica PCC 7403]